MDVFTKEFFWMVCTFRINPRVIFTIACNFADLSPKKDYCLDLWKHQSCYFVATKKELCQEVYEKPFITTVSSEMGKCIFSCFSVLFENFVFKRVFNLFICVSTFCFSASKKEFGGSMFGQDSQGVPQDFREFEFFVCFEVLTRGGSKVLET